MFPDLRIYLLQLGNNYITMSTQIPPLYRFIFTYIDPILFLYGLYYFHIIAIPSISLPPNTIQPQDLLSTFTTALFVLLTYLSTVLLRFSDDVTVWSIYQAALLKVELILLWGLYGILSQQGRINPMVWTPEEYVFLGVTISTAILRFLFWLGVGVRKGSGGGKKQA